jgi:hypothetical protein
MKLKIKSAIDISVFPAPGDTTFIALNDAAAKLSNNIQERLVNIYDFHVNCQIASSASSAAIMQGNSN